MLQPHQNSTTLSSDLAFDQEQTPVKKTEWVHQVPEHQINPYPRWTVPVLYQYLSVSLFSGFCTPQENHGVLK